MNILNEIIMSNFIPFATLVFLLFFIIFNPLYSKEKRDLFIVTVLVNLAMIIIVSADYFFSGSDGNSWIFRRITTFLNFAASPLIPLLLLKIFEQKKYSLAFYLPFIINAVLCFISIFTGIIFNITQENTYSRGFLFFVPFIASLIYIILLIIKPISYHVNSKKNERVFLFFVIVLLILSMYFEISLAMKFLVWNASAIGITLYYVFLTIHLFIVDSLTGVYNRYMYSMTLDRIDKTSSCVIALLDINNFKEINDEKGHDYGDFCLKLFSQVINNHILKIATLYRIGGDEFVILSKSNELSKVQNALEEAQKELSEKNISFAFGIVKYNPENNLHKVLEDADKLMYDTKSKMKKSI